MLEVEIQGLFNILKMGCPSQQFHSGSIILKKHVLRESKGSHLKQLPPIDLRHQCTRMKEQRNLLVMIQYPRLLRTITGNALPRLHSFGIGIAEVTACHICTRLFRPAYQLFEAIRRDPVVTVYKPDEFPPADG